MQLVESEADLKSDPHLSHYLLSIDFITSFYIHPPMISAVFLVQFPRSRSTLFELAVAPGLKIKFGSIRIKP